jgi:hypothetical protein
MKCSRRWLFNGVVALSLVLCISVAVLSFGMTSPTDFRVLSVQTPGAEVWRFDTSYQGVTIARFHPWPMAQSGFGIRYGRFDLRSWTPLESVWLGKPSITSSQSQGDFSLTSGTVFFTTSRPAWDSPVVIRSYPPSLNLVPSSASVSLSILFIPYWIVLGALGFLPAVWLFVTARHLLRKRPSDGTCCLVCGYDLRATPERCPECGTVRVFTRTVREEVPLNPITPADGVASAPARRLPEG